MFSWFWIILSWIGSMLDCFHLFWLKSFQFLAFNGSHPWLDCTHCSWLWRLAFRLLLLRVKTFILFLFGINWFVPLSINWFRAQSFACQSSWYLGSSSLSHFSCFNLIWPWPYEIFTISIKSLPLERPLRPSKPFIGLTHHGAIWGYHGQPLNPGLLITLSWARIGLLTEFLGYFSSMRPLSSLRLLPLLIEASDDIRAWLGDPILTLFELQRRIHLLLYHHGLWLLCRDFINWLYRSNTDELLCWVRFEVGGFWLGGVLSVYFEALGL